MQGAYIEFGGWQAGWGLQGLAWNTLEEEALCQPLHVLSPFTELCHHCRSAHYTVQFTALHCEPCSHLTVTLQCTASPPLQCNAGDCQCSAVHNLEETMVQCRIWRRQPRTDPTQSSSCTTTNYHIVLQLHVPLLKAAAPLAL